MEQPKVERMLRLMKLLTGNTAYTVEDLAEKLDTTYRSIYRYLDSFKEAGFAVRKVRPGVYELVAMAQPETGGKEQENKTDPHGESIHSQNIHIRELCIGKSHVTAFGIKIAAQTCAPNRMTFILNILNV